jgi:hypothetical protein
VPYVFFASPARKHACPGIHGADPQTARGGEGLRLRHVGEEPANLRGRKVRADGKSRARLHLRLAAAGDQRVAVGVGARVLPDDRGGDRDPGARVPEDDRLALVRHAEREHGSTGPGGDRFGDDAVDIVPNLESVVLDPAGMGKDLRVLAVGGGDHAPGKIEQEAARSGGPLVDRRKEGHRTEAISSRPSAFSGQLAGTDGRTPGHVSLEAVRNRASLGPVCGPSRKTSSPVHLPGSGVCVAVLWYRSARS